LTLFVVLASTIGSAFSRRCLKPFSLTPILALVVTAIAGEACAAGFEARTLEWALLERSYLIHVPPDAGSAPLALVIALHGAGGDAKSFAEETGMETAADASGMMVVFPEGTGRTFNAQICCGEAVARQIDDIGFIGAVIDDVGRHWALDRTRIYVTGMSNGGMLAYQLAALHPDRFAAVAPVAGAIGGMTRAGRTYLIPVPELPVPVMIVHGMLDRMVPYDGGSSPFLNFPSHWKLSVADAFTFWAAADHCRGEPETREIVAGKLRSSVYAACAGNSMVRLLAVEDGDHAWPGDFFPAGEGTRSAAAEILTFFAGFRRLEPRSSDHR